MNKWLLNMKACVNKAVTFLYKNPNLQQCIIRQQPAALALLTAAFILSDTIMSSFS